MSVRDSWLSLDLRSLALFRMLLGGLVMADLLQHLSGVEAFFSDQGVLPRSLLRLPLASQWLCAFMGSGQVWVQVCWMGVALLCAGCFLVGNQVRLMGFWTWFFLASLHVRDSLPGDRGCMLLEIMLFWSFFLPLEARWSWSSRRHPHWRELPQRFRSAGTVALILQLALLYAYTTALKNGGAWVLRFNAVEVALRSAQVSTPYSEWLATLGSRLTPVTILVLVFEGLLPLLLLSPLAHERLRWLALLLLLTFHLHNSVCFHLGIFPLSNALLSLVLLTPGAWETRPGQALSRFLDALWQGSSPTLTTPFPPAYRLGKTSLAWISVCLAYCFYCNHMTCPDPDQARLVEPLRSFGKFTRLEQRWDLFSPGPPNDLWFRLLAQDERGTEVDLLRPDRTVTLDRPSAPMGTVSHGWQMFLLNTVYRTDLDVLRQLMDYWQRHYPQYHHLRYQVVRRYFDPQGRPGPPEVEQLWPNGRVIQLPDRP